MAETSETVRNNCSNSFSVPGVILGYQVYQRIWTPVVGENIVYSWALTRRDFKGVLLLIRRGGIIRHGGDWPRQKITPSRHGHGNTMHTDFLT